MRGTRGITTAKKENSLDRSICPRPFTVPMKIGFVVDRVSRQAGGLFQSVRRLAQSLGVMDGEVRAFGIKDADSVADLAEWQPVPVQTFPSQGLRAWGYSNQLLSALLVADLDVLLTHGLWKYSSLASQQWHRRSGRPYIVHPHGMLAKWALKNSKWKKRIAGMLYEDRHLRDAACLRALCDAEAQSIRDYGLRNPVCVIPNGIDLPDSQVVRHAPWSGGAADGKVLLHLGRLHPKKNLLALIDAWATIRRTTKSRDWLLVIAGWDEGGYKALLQRRARDLGIENNVHFSEPLFGEEKAAAYQKADAFVLPSLSEGLPMAVLEAWAFAKPVLITPECNLPEGFAANAAIQIGTASDSIRPGLFSLFEMSNAERIEMGARGRALAAERFAWPAIGEEMKRVCEWVIGGGPAPASVRFN
jgi:glycosyltransferase involved in cell wall biosynthesis